MLTKTFQEEQNEALIFLLKEFEKVWKQPIKAREEFDNEHKTASNKLFLEVFLTPECNQSCEYCYVVKHGKELYPTEIRDKNTILKNFKILLEYARINKLYLPKMDLFTGEIWGYPFGNKVLDIILEELKVGLILPVVLIPSNLSFCKNQTLIDLMQYYIEEFKKYNCRLYFSCSMDGPYLDKLNRPFKGNNIKDDEYYNNIFAFCKRNDYGFHPMIAAATVEHQIENYDSWIQKLHEFFPDEDDFAKTYGSIMQLEVRDDEWTEDKIMSYLKWVKYLMEKDKKEYCYNDDDIFFNTCFYMGPDAKKVYKQSTYYPYILTRSESFPTCTAGRMLSIRAGDLAITPCHRTCYPKFNFGKLLVENDTIVGVEANNISLMNAWFMTGNSLKPKCDNCVLTSLCLRGCFGAQYESSKEILFPCESVCNLFIAKFAFLINYFKRFKGFNSKEFALYNKRVYEEIQKIEKTEEFKQWTQKLQHLI